MPEHELISAVQPAAPRLSVVVHLFVAFDWGDGIDLDRARQLPAAERHTLPRARRTPPSIEYRPYPLRFRLPAPSSLPTVPGFPDSGSGDVAIDATVFDFGAVSVAAHVPVQLSDDELQRLAGSLSDSQPVVAWARAAVEDLHQRLLPAISQPEWSTLTEEYVVFELRRTVAPTITGEFSGTRAAWLAGLVRLESAELSGSEIDEALKSRMSYLPDDLVIVDWAGAVLIDENPDEVLDVIAFANLQLLELRQINRQLERELESAWHISRKHARSWLPFWRSHARRVRALGSVKVDAHGTLERTNNILKIVGDPYLARVYQLLAARFRLDEWANDNRRSIHVLEGVYQVLTQQSATYRAEFLELTIVLLILFEIIAQFWSS